MRIGFLLTLHQTTKEWRTYESADELCKKDSFPGTANTSLSALIPSKGYSEEFIVHRSAGCYDSALKAKCKAIMVHRTGYNRRQRGVHKAALAHLQLLQMPDIIR